MNEISPIENRYMGLMRGLDHFTRDRFAVEIKDHDYAPGHDVSLPQHHSLVGFQRELNKLYDDVDGHVMNSEAIRRNIESTSHVIDAIPYALTSDGVGKTDFPDYVERVMGIRPEEIPEEELSEQREEVAGALAELGFEYSDEDREKFHNEYAVPAKQLESTVLRLAGVTRDDIIEAAGSQALYGIEEPKINTVNVSDTWQGYFGTEDKKFFIDININPILRINELEERVVLDHERGHALSAATSKLRIASGELSPAMGMLLCQSPVYSQEEVIARAIERYTLGEQPGDLAGYLYPAMRYENNVGTNMILKANTGMDAKEVFDYGRERLPFEEPEKTRKFVEMITKNLVFKTVFAVDSVAMEAGERIAALSDTERRTELTRLCAGPVDIDELLDSGFAVAS